MVSIILCIKCQKVLNFENRYGGGEFHLCLHESTWIRIHNFLQNNVKLGNLIFM